jgi:hypothetical protein
MVRIMTFGLELEARVRFSPRMVPMYILLGGWSTLQGGRVEALSASLALIA